MFFLSFLLQFIYYAAIYSGVLFLKDFGNKNISKAVSVIISARNESENLKFFLPFVLNQNYKEFEVIVANDRSDDDSKDILEAFQKRYSNLSVVTIDFNEKNATGKKYALTKAINIAKYEHLLFTDADCYPVSQFWIQSITAAYSAGKDIVLGYGGYEFKKGFLNKLIRFDTLFIALQYFAFAKLGIAYMGVGRNLSYKKKLFVKHSGFSGHMHILSGDDDLHINKISNITNTAVTINKDSITKSVPKKKFKDWIVQKRRHITTGFYYKFIHKILLSLEPLSKLIFYLAFIAGLVFCKYVLLLISVFMIRYIIQFFIIGLFAKKIEEKKILIFIPIFDILIPALNLFVIISNIFIQKKEWN